MRLIEDISYYKKVDGLFVFQEKTKINEELERPFIQFENSNQQSVKLWFDNQKVYKIKDLSVNPYSKWVNHFSYEELNFLAKKFNFSLTKYEDYNDIFDGVISNSKFTQPGQLIYIEEFGSTYLIIEFKRWQYDRPRSAGEDAMGEDITYIHGIWENPKLPKEVIDRIKN